MARAPTKTPQSAGTGTSGAPGSGGCPTALPTSTEPSSSNARSAQDVRWALIAHERAAGGTGNHRTSRQLAPANSDNGAATARSTSTSTNWTGGSPFRGAPGAQDQLYGWGRARIENTNGVVRNDGGLDPRSCRASGTVAHSMAFLAMALVNNVQLADADPHADSPANDVPRAELSLLCCPLLRATAAATERTLALPERTALGRSLSGHHPDLLSARS